ALISDAGSWMALLPSPNRECTAVFFADPLSPGTGRHLWKRGWRDPKSKLMSGPNITSLTLNQNRAARILIIDDEPSVLSVLYSLLCRTHDCKTATSAVEAIEYLKEETYDLVLSDIMMPGM